MVASPRLNASCDVSSSVTGIPALATGGDAGRCFLAVLLVPTGQGDVTAEVGQRRGDGLCEGAAPPGDERDLSVEPELPGDEAGVEARGHVAAFTVDEPAF